MHNSIQNLLEEIISRHVRIARIAKTTKPSSTNRGSSVTSLKRYTVMTEKDIRRDNHIAPLGIFYFKRGSFLYVFQLHRENAKRKC
ncbi:hypothetical protein BH18THE2_BH18THE2_28360 [soil metagenome]